jgi:hypothetical protein
MHGFSKHQDNVGFSESYRASPGGDHKHWRERVLTDQELLAQEAARRTAAEERQAVLAWMRTQVAPALDRSLAAITGKRIKKPPTFGNALIAQPQNISLPESVINRNRRMVNGRLRIDVGGPASKASGDPIMKRWTIERLPSSEFNKPTFLYRDPPWCHPFPNVCVAYGRSLKILSKDRKRIIKLDVGFRLQPLGMFVGQPDRLYPTSNYVPYRRSRPAGRVQQPGIPDDDAWQAQMMVEASFASDTGEEPVLLEDNMGKIPGEIPEPNIVGFGPLTSEVTLAAEEPDDEDVVSLSFDMTTTLPWQRSPSPEPHEVEGSTKKSHKKSQKVLKRLERDRRKAYEEWHNVQDGRPKRLPGHLLRDGVEVHKTGRPPKGQELSVERVSEIAAFGIQAREAHGYNKALRLMQDRFLIKRSRAKRILDAEIRNEPTCSRFSD